MKSEIATGTIQFSSEGSAVVKDKKANRNVFIHRRKTGAAITGDEVSIRISNRHRSRFHNGHPVNGKVLKVLHRNCSTVVGTLRKKHTTFFLEPQRLDTGRNISVVNPEVAKLGDRVVVKLLTDKGSTQNLPSGRIIEVIGSSKEPTLDTLCVIKAYELPTYFPKDVIQQAETITVTNSDLSSRLDLQNKFVFTVDPIDAKDFDDAISLEKNSNGKRVLGIHIADVSHFIPVNSPLDKEAIRRGNSIYFPDTVIPMVPEHLSNGICSLKHDVTRLTISILITLDDTITPSNIEFHESAIRSRCRLNYSQVQSVLNLKDGEELPDPGLDKKTVATLKELNQIAQTFRKRRFQSGALNMEISEIQFSVGTDGRIESIVPSRSDEAHQLIEELMLLANEIVCKELTEKRIPHLYRVHDEPDLERIAELEDSLRLAGLQVNDLTVRQNLCETLSMIANSPQAYALNTAILRSMKKAVYSEKATGHYGLAKHHYTHFTSPIRRYPDLVVHRILKAYLRKQKPVYKKSLLSEFAQRCSEREMVGAKAEREVKNLKIIRYFHEQIEAGDLQEYEAVVVDVKKRGLVINIPEVQAYGMIHKSMLGDRIYFNSVKKQFFNRGKNATLFKMGSCLQVKIARVELEKRFLDFAPVIKK